MKRKTTLIIIMIVVLISLYLVLPHGKVGLVVDSKKLRDGARIRLPIGGHDLSVIGMNWGLPFRDGLVVIEAVPLGPHISMVSLRLEPQTLPCREIRGRACVWNYSSQVWLPMIRRVHDVTLTVNEPCRVEVRAYLCYWWIRRINDVHSHAAAYIEFQQET